MLPNKSLNLAAIIAILRRRAALLLVPPAVTFFAALLYSSTIPNLYQSDMLIAIIPQRVPDTFVRSTVTARADQRLDEISVQVMSRTNLVAIINELGLYKEELSRMPMEDVVAKMRNDLDIGLEPLRRGPRGPEPPHAFHVRFTYGDPATAAAITQRVGAMFVEENSRGRGALAQATNAFLESELEQARRRLEEQERRLEEFRQRHGKELPTQLQSNMEAARGLQMQVQGLVESIARDRDRKLMLERLYREAVNDAPASTVAAVPAGPAGATAPTTLEQQLLTARASLANLETRYTADHPDVVRTRQQIAELEQRVKTEAAVVAAGGTPAPRVAPADPAATARRENLRQMLAEIESLDRQTAFKESEERRLRKEIADYVSRVEAVPGIESEWVKLSRDYDTNQAAYRELLSKAEAARVAVNLEQREIGEQFRIVDAAQVPVQPVTSIRAGVNAGGLLLGLLIGAVAAIILELRDTTYRTESDVVAVLSLPVLALVPALTDAAAEKRTRNRRWAVSVVAMLCIAGAGYLTWSLKLWNSLI